MTHTGKTTFTGIITGISQNANGIIIGNVKSCEAFPEYGWSKFNDKNCYNSKVKDYAVNNEVEFEINKYNYPMNLRLKGTTMETPILKEYWVNWFDLAEDIKRLSPETEKKSEKEIFWSICDNNNGRNNIVYLDTSGMQCNKDVAYYMYIPTGFNNEIGKELFLKYRKQLIKDGTKYVYSNTVYEGIERKDLKRSDILFSYARFDDFNDSISNLSELAMDEDWSYKGDPIGLLKRFIIYTFAHEYLANNVKKSPKKAVFNTGLVDKFYNPIYGVFELIKDETDNDSCHSLFICPKYRFVNFTKEDKHIMNELEIPEAVPYFDETNVSFFNTKYDIVWDKEHIIKGRMNRMPLWYFERYEHHYGEIRSILQENQDDDDEKLKAIQDFIKDETDDAQYLFEQIKGDMDSCLKSAKTRAQYNFRCAVPSYNPERDEYSFLLPVSLGPNPKKVDIAAIASVEHYGERKEKTRYRIQTIIPLDWAYLDARLVCSPESSWLSLEKIFKK